MAGQAGPMTAAVVATLTGDVSPRAPPRYAAPPNNAAKPAESVVTCAVRANIRDSGATIVASLPKLKTRRGSASSLRSG